MPVKRSQSGFTLVEILIAIVIFSIGLLGIAGLQVSGMRFTHDAQLRSIAVAQAETMADMMRANEAGMRDGSYNIQDAMPDDFDPDCGALVCTAEERAVYDLKVWNTTTLDAPLEANQDVLPNGHGVVCVDSTPDDGTLGAWECDNVGVVYAIKIEWDERTVSNDDVAARGKTDTNVHTQRFVLTVIPAIDS